MRGPNGVPVAASGNDAATIIPQDADSGEAGHLFQFHSGHHSDLKPEVAASELEEEPAIKTADGPEVGVFDLGVVAQSGGTGFSFSAIAFRIIISLPIVGSVKITEQRHQRVERKICDKPNQPRLAAA